MCSTTNSVSHLQRQFRFSVCMWIEWALAHKEHSLSLGQGPGPRDQVRLRLEQLSMYCVWEFPSLSLEGSNVSCSSVWHSLKSVSTKSSEGTEETKWVLWEGVGRGAAWGPWRTGRDSSRSSLPLPGKERGPNFAISCLLSPRRAKKFEFSCDRLQFLNVNN